jgi:hypothetical protein
MRNQSAGDLWQLALHFLHLEILKNGVVCGAMKVPTNVTSWGSNVEAIRVLALFGSNSVLPAGKQQPQHFGIGLHGIPVRLAGAPGGHRTLYCFMFQ